MVDPAGIMDAIYAFTDFLLRYGIALAAVGALSMALIEAWKKLFDTRTKYHMRAVLAWIGADRAYLELVHLTTGSALPPPEAAARHAHLAHARTPMPRDFELALFTLELERMMGH